MATTGNSSEQPQREPAEISDPTRSPNDAALPDDVGQPVDTSDDDGELEVFSLDDLGAAYARAAAAIDAEDEGPPPTSAATVDRDRESKSNEPIAKPAIETQTANTGAESDDVVVTPEAIVEAALFVGHPENKSFSEKRLASIIRGVSPSEVVTIIDELNQSYQDADQALRIVKDEHGYRMSIAPQVESVRRSFLGKVREARLSPAAIEVLALVAYQPGITAQKVQDQRGQESGSVLNQLVRRELLRIERVKPDDGGRTVTVYHTTERFLVLFGLESIEELPHVEEELRDMQ